MAVQPLQVDRTARVQVPDYPMPGQRKTFAQLIRTDPLSTIVTISIDVLSATVATMVASGWASRTHERTPPLWMILLFVPIVIAVLGLRSIYRRRLNRTFLNEVGPIVTGVGLASMLLLGVFVVADEHASLGSVVLKVWVSAAILMPLGRLIRATIQRSLRRQHHLVSPTLVVGNGQVAYHIIKRLNSAPEYGLSPIGLVDADPPWTRPDDRGVAPDIPYLGTPDTVEEVITKTGAEAMVIAFSLTHDELLAPMVRIAHRRALRVWVVPRMFDVISERARVEHVGGLPLLALPHTNPKGWQFAVKDIGDRIAAAIGLLLMSPLLLTLMALVRFSSPGPIFFRQPRIGRDGKVFDCLKFRTMRNLPAPLADFELKDGTAPGGVEGMDRRTTIGKVMRATSMDELPQLLNVLKGEMSLVGPRPERPEYVDLFDMQIRRYGERHRVKAGLTGWAQVHGLRGQTSIADRAEWDNYYIENWSLALDMKILALTIPAVFRRAE